MSLIVLRAADGFVTAASETNQLPQVCATLRRPVTAFHWRRVGGRPVGPIAGWKLDREEVIR